MGKRVLICSNIIWTITQFRLGLIKALRKSGCEVVCVADHDNFSNLSLGKVAEAGARFIRLPVSRRGLSPLNEFAYFVRLLGILRKEKPDVILNYTIKPVIYGSIAATLLRIPSFAVMTGLGSVFVRDTLLTCLVRLLYSMSLRCPARVFFLNHEDMDALLESGLVDRSKAILLPGEGIDTDHYRPDEGHSSPGGFTFLLIARLLWEKGLGEYAEAASLVKATHPNVRFQLAGYLDSDNPSGISEDQLKRWVDDGVIQFLGAKDDVRPFIMEADCVVLPSYYREGVPRVLLEASSMGKPIITTNSPGCKDVVADRETGFICKARDSKSLHQRMLDMMRLSADERRRMGSHGREKMISEFSEELVVRRYLDELEPYLLNR